MSSATTVPALLYRFGRFDLHPDERRLLADGADVHLLEASAALVDALLRGCQHLVVIVLASVCRRRST
jgi:hypothetical protein